MAGTAASVVSRHWAQSAVESAGPMPGSHPNPVLRGRIETGIRILSPLLDLLLAVGDRVSRVLERDDPEYVPARMPSEGESAPRGTAAARAARAGTPRLACQPHDRRRAAALRIPRAHAPGGDRRLAGILLVGAAALQLTGPHTKVNELTLDLITAHKRFPIDVVGAVINGIGLCALAATLVFLLDITRARNPRLVKPWIRWMVLVGGVVAAISGDRLRDRHRRQGRHIRQPGSADLRAGQPSDQCPGAAGAAVRRPGLRAPAGGRASCSSRCRPCASGC